jgi:hypothetical protein
VALRGDLNLGGEDMAWVAVTNGLVLEGTVQVGSPSYYYRGALRFLGSQSLSGNGTVVFGMSDQNAVYQAQEGAVLTLGPQIRLEGQNGTLGASAGHPWYGPANVQVINQGTVAANKSGGLIVLGAELWSNEGRLEAGAGATLRLVRRWVNTGLIRLSGGTLDLQGSFSTRAIGTRPLNPGVSCLPEALLVTKEPLKLFPEPRWM